METFINTLMQTKFKRSIIYDYFNLAANAAILLNKIQEANMNKDLVLKIKSNPKYQELVSKRNSFQENYLKII